MGRLLIATFGDSKPFFTLIALMMEAARTSETLVNFYQTTRCYNPEDSNLHTGINLVKFDNGDLLADSHNMFE
jgi:hypothetical protein